MQLPRPASMGHAENLLLHRPSAHMGLSAAAPGRDRPLPQRGTEGCFCTVVLLPGRAPQAVLGVPGAEAGRAGLPYLLYGSAMLRSIGAWWERGRLGQANSFSPEFALPEAPPGCVPVLPIA